MNKEIEIPEGYKARIEGNKVIIEPNENEDERIRKSIIHLLQVGGYMSLEDKEKAFAYLEKQKEQKSVECLKPERDCWYVCIKDFYGGGKKQCSKGDLVQAKGGMYMMGRKDISEWFRKAYYDEINPVEWSEEDERMVSWIRTALSTSAYITPRDTKIVKEWLENRLKLFCPQPHWKPSEEQMNALQAFVGMIHPDARYNAVFGLLEELKAL